MMKTSPLLKSILTHCGQNLSTLITGRQLLAPDYKYSRNEQLVQSVLSKPPCSSQYQVWGVATDQHTHCFSRVWKYETNFGSSVSRLKVTGSHFGPGLSGSVDGCFTARLATMARRSLTVSTISQGNWLMWRPGWLTLSSLPETIKDHG